MVDVVTRTTHQGFFSRLMSSFVGILIGLVMIPGSVALISWNEYRTIHRTQGLLEAESVVAEVPDPLEISSTLNERLIHTTGNATTDELLSDSEFAIARQALRLQRNVEMYQWVEHEESRTRDKVGGGRETVKTYEYRREWREGRENSSSFQEPSGHENPQPRFSSQSLVSDRAKLGAFQLRQDLVTQINTWKDLPADLTALEKLDEAARQPFRTDGPTLYYSSTTAAAESSPQIGDLRISFRIVEPTVVSVLSKQRDQTLEPFKTKNGETVEALQVGSVSAPEMFEDLRRQNNFLAMLLRGVGWLLACIGFGLIVAPVKTIASIVPFFGRLVGVATGAIAFVLGSVVALMTIAVAWIAVRPLYGIGLTLFAALGIYFLFRWSRRDKPNSVVNSQPPSPSVPPPLPPALP